MDDDIQPEVDDFEQKDPEGAFVQEEADEGNEIREEDFPDRELYRKIKKNLEGYAFFNEGVRLESASKVISLVWKKFLYYSEDMSNTTAQLRYLAIRPEDQKKDVVLSSAVRYVFDYFKVQKDDLFVVEAFLFFVWLAFVCLIPKQLTITIGVFLLLCGTSFLYLPVMVAGLKVAYMLLSRAMCEKSKEYVQNAVPYPGISLFWVMMLAGVGALPFIFQLVPGSSILTLVTWILMAILISHLPHIATKAAINNTLLITVVVFILAVVAAITSVKPRDLWTFYQFPFAESKELYLLAESYHEHSSYQRMMNIWTEMNDTLKKVPTVIVPEIDNSHWLYTESNFIFSYLMETFMFGVLLASCGMYPALMKCITERIASLSSKNKDMPLKIRDHDVGYAPWLNAVPRNIILLFAETAVRWIWWKGTFVAILISAVTAVGAILLSYLLLKLTTAPLIDTAANAAVAGKGLADGNATFGIYSIGTLVNGKMQQYMYNAMECVMLLNLLVSLATRSHITIAMITFGLLMHTAMIVSNVPVRVKQNISLFAISCGNMNPISTVYLLYQLVIRRSKDFEIFINPLPPETGGTPIVYQT